MADAADIRPHMEVLGSDGAHIGTVDHVANGRIKLTRQDSNDDERLYLPIASVTRVDTHVHVNTTAEAMGLLAVAGARGAAPANDRLSEQRAQAVVAALAAKGVATGRLTPRSGGENDPADTNATAQGCFHNRRSELIVTGK